MRIISFDPGGTTGVAIYDDEPILENDPEWEFHSLGPHEHHRELWEMLLTDGPFDHVVYETFLYQRRSVDKGISLELISKEYIGIIKLAHARHRSDVPTLTGQSPPQRMFWTDYKLKALSLWRSSPHERDAVRHLLYYLTFTLKDDRFLQRLK